MEFFEIAVSVTAGVVLGILIEKALAMSKENKAVDKEKLLEECFGEHMCVGKFSLVQVRDWIKAHQENLNNGSKALVLKITPETLKSIGKNIEITDNMDDYLAIAIINSNTEQMESSILVKYKELDEKLEEILAKGDGTLVVEG